MYSNLKRTSTVSTTTDPETGEITDVDPRAGGNLKLPKPSGAGAPLIRSMLNSLNPEKD